MQTCFWSAYMTRERSGELCKPDNEGEVWIDLHRPDMQLNLPENSISLVMAFAQAEGTPETGDQAYLSNMPFAVFIWWGDASVSPATNKTYLHMTLRAKIGRVLFLQEWCAFSLDVTAGYEYEMQKKKKKKKSFGSACFRIFMQTGHNVFTSLAVDLTVYFISELYSVFGLMPF